MYKKPKKTGKPNPITAVKPGSVDDLMTRYNTSRTAKKEKQTRTMLFEATIQINDPEEVTFLRGFLDVLDSYRKDPFALKAEAENLDTLVKTQAAMKFDELVPPELPAYATADEPPGRDIEEAHPTEDDAVAAFKKFAATHKAEESVALVKSFNVARVKELKPEQRARFIAEASRAT